MIALGITSVSEKLHLCIEREASVRQIISSTKLNWWFNSGSRDGQELLPHFVRRLIMATTTLGSLSEFRIPVGDEVGRPGYDGRMRFHGTHPFVPNGLSV